MPTNKLAIFQDQSPFALDDISVASPCHAEWNDMVGSDKVRFCASCQKNVFNLSSMKRADAIALVRATEGRICVRFFRRADGTVLTEDCPVGVALLVRRAKRATLAAAAVSVGAIAAVLAMFSGAFGGAKKACDALVDVKQTIEQRIEPVEPLPMMGAPPPPDMQHTMGEPAPIPEPVVEMGKPAPPPRKVMGKIAMPTREVKGDLVRPDVEDRPAVEWE